jgi:hypothetical protein
MSFLDSSKAKLNLWIIHTGCPGYTINIADMDPETSELMAVVKKGREALEQDTRTRHLSKQGRAAESLDYTPEREDNMKYAVADTNGDFYIDDPEVAKAVWNLLQKDPDPKPRLDPRCPPIPGVDTAVVKDTKAVINAPFRPV